MPTWPLHEEESEATGLQLRREYGRVTTTLETDIGTMTWRGVNYYYGLGVRAITDESYRGVRDQDFDFGPATYPSDNVYVGTPSTMFNVAEWTYGDVPNGVLVHRAGTASGVEIQNHLDLLLGVRLTGPAWAAGSSRWGVYPESGSGPFTINDWIAAGPWTNTFYPPLFGGEPGIANGLHSYILAFTPDPDAPLDAWQTLMHVEGTDVGVFAWITFSYRLLS